MDKIGFLKFRDEEAAHLVNGKVPASELPSYVDDVIEGYLYEGSFYEESTHTTLITPEMGKIYVDIQTGYTYRWSGSTYIRINDIDTSMFPRKSRYRFLLQDENYVVSNMYGYGPDGQILSPYTVVETLTDLVASKRIATFECLDENGETIILPNIYHIRGTYLSQECTLIVSGFSKNGEIITFSHTGSGNYFTKTVTSKLDKNQGSANAGKFMKIGTDGNLTPEPIPTPTSSYNDLTNKPTLNGVTITGAKTSADFGFAAQHTKATISLTVAGWDSTTNTQTVSITGLGATDDVLVGPTYASAADWASGNVLCSAQASGSLTFHCDTIPTNAISATALIFGASATLADTEVY